MATIYLDESGDLGFALSKQNSKYFVATFLFVPNPRVVDKVVRKCFLALPERVRKKHPGAFHCCKERPATRRKLLSLLAERDIKILSIRLNKSRVYTKLQDEKQVLYNYVANILLDRILRKRLIPGSEVIELVASRRETNRYLNENFCSYLEGQVRGNHKRDLRVSIRPPSADRGLQAVDFVCWAMFRRWERGDSSYYEIIKQRVVEESELFGS